MKSPTRFFRRSSRRPVSATASAILLTLLTLMTPAVPIRADIFDLFGINKPKTADPATAALGAALGEDKVIAGLREALGKGLKQAVSDLGKPGGFLTNLDVKIPMPAKLQSVERGLRAVGQDKLADDFVGSLNRAAEKAVPEAAAVFADSLQKMTIADARNILNGPPDAATQFFARTTRTNLAERFLPLVKKATDEVGVTAAYKNMTGHLTAADSLGGGLLGGLRKSVVDDQAMDLDGYVNERALDGLFKMVADEEKRIRANPAARTTELLKEVFGSVLK